jgi:nicotinate-nucleotide adenylyltransferase
MDLDLVIFLPCRQSPHKIGEKHADSSHRLKMCELAIADYDWAIVDNFDLIAPEPCYSWRTAEAMRDRYSKADLSWLMGTDQWITLHTWNNPDRLSKVVEFIVYDRGAEATPRDGFRMHPIHGNHPASATTIREKLADGMCQNWLNPDVLDYIQENGLYDTSPKSDQADG